MSGVGVKVFESISKPERFDRYGVVDSERSRAVQVCALDIGSTTLLTVRAAYVGDRVGFDDGDSRISGYDETFPMTAKGNNRQVSMEVSPPVAGDEQRQAAAVAFALASWGVYEQMVAADSAVSAANAGLATAVNTAINRPQTT